MILVENDSQKELLRRLYSVAHINGEWKSVSYSDYMSGLQAELLRMQQTHYNFVG